MRMAMILNMCLVHIQYNCSPCSKSFINETDQLSLKYMYIQEQTNKKSEINLKKKNNLEGISYISKGSVKLK
jgi:hypothetical protein